MIKKIALCLAYCISTTILQAQILSIDSIELKQFEVKSSPNNGGVLIHNIVSGKNTVLEILYAKNGYATLSKIETPVSKTAIVADASIMDEGILVLTIDAAQKNSVLTLFGFEGKILQQKTEQIAVLPPGNTMKQYYTGIMMGTYYTIMPEADKSGGYKITTYDNELKELSKQSYTGRKGMLELITVKKEMDKLYLLRKEVLDAKQQKYAYSIHTFSPHMPDAAGTVSLEDNEGDYSMPLNINARHGMLFVAGAYYKNGKYEDGKAAGIMIQQMAPDGQVIRKAKIPADRLNQFLPDTWIASLSKDAYLSVLDVYDNMGKIVVVGEMLKKEVKGKDTRLQISDMIVMHINQENDIEKLQFVEKSPAMNINLSGIASTYNLHNTAEWLCYNKLYNYQFSLNINGKQHLCYMNADTAQIAATMSVTDADSVVGENSGIILLSRLPDPNRHMSRKLKLSLNADKPETTMRAASRYTYVLPLDEIRILICNYSRPRLQLIVDTARK